MIRDYYLTLPLESFDDKTMFKEQYTHPKVSIEGGEDNQAQEWQGMVKELKRHTELLSQESIIQQKRTLRKQTQENEEGMRKQTQEIDKRIEGIDLSIRKQAKENEEGMRKQTQEIEEGMRKQNQEIDKRIQGIDLSIREKAKENEEGTRKQTQEIDQRLARLEQLILDINTKLSHNN